MSDRMIRYESIPGSASPEVPVSEPGSEHRREHRRSASGPVLIRVGYPKNYEVEGRLVDVSPSGFRMLHNCHTLETGQTVTFSHREAHGNARVVWIRIVGEMVETGFFVVRA